MPEPEQMPELVDQGEIEIVAVCASRRRAGGYALGVGDFVVDIERDEDAGPGTLSTLLPMTEGAPSGEDWYVPAVAADHREAAAYR